MYCKECNVNVDTARTTCPLCGAVLSGDPCDAPPFPERRMRKRKRPFSVKQAYAVVTIPALIICIILNCVLPHKYIWALMVTIGVLYGYFTLKTTIFYRGAGGAKIFSQTLMLTVICISAQYIFRTPEWAFGYAAPVIALLSVALHVILFGVFGRRRGNQYFRYMWMSSLLGLLPAIMLAVGVAEFPYLIYVSFIVSAVSVLALILFSGRVILAEIKKKSHI